MKSKFQTYRDGLLRVYQRNGQLRNVHSLDQLTEVVKLMYESKNVRQEDTEFAYAEGHQISMKVCVPLVKCVKSTHMVVVEDTLYSIYRLDPDKKKQRMYLYLEEVCEIEREGKD